MLWNRPVLLTAFTTADLRHACYLVLRTIESSSERRPIVGLVRHICFPILMRLNGKTFRGFGLGGANKPLIGLVPSEGEH